MAERVRLLVLDLLETYARERDIDVRLERRHELDLWFCVLSRNSRERFAAGVGGQPARRFGTRSNKWG